MLYGFIHGQFADSAVYPLQFSQERKDKKRANIVYREMNECVCVCVSGADGIFELGGTLTSPNQLCRVIN